MSDDITQAHKGTAKDLFKLIVHSPALLAAFLVGLVLLIYFLAKKGPSSGGTSATGTDATAGTATPLSVVGLRPQFIVNSPATTLPTAPTAPQTSTPVPAVPTAAPIAAPTQTFTAPHSDYAVIRSKGSIPTVASYDAKNTGVPIRSAAGSGNDVIGSVGFGSQVQITGPAVQGVSSNLPGSSNGTNLWYPVTVNGQTGYVSAFDVTNSYQQ